MIDSSEMKDDLLEKLNIPDSFRKVFAEAAAVVKTKAGPGGVVRVIHHNDSDGITSGAILTAAFTRAGYKVVTCSLEKPYPVLIPVIHGKQHDLVVYGDLGSAYIKDISCATEQVSGITVIVDHHLTGPSPSGSVLNVNGELHGLSGSLDISGAATCFLLAVYLSAENRDLVPLAVVGGFEIPGPLRGVNAVLYDLAHSLGLVQHVDRSAWRTGQVRLGNDWVALSKAFSDLETCGAVGYYLGGVEVALALCRDGYTDEALTFLEKVDTKRRQAFRLLDEAVCGGRLVRTGNVQYLHADFALNGLGAKVIGSYLSGLSRRDIPAVDGKCYLLASVSLNPEVPGVGSLGTDQVKFSGRVAPGKAESILSGKASSLNDLFAGAGTQCGGYGDGHKVAASAVVPAANRLRFVELVNELSGG